LKISEIIKNQKFEKIARTRFAPPPPHRHRLDISQMIHFSVPKLNLVDNIKSKRKSKSSFSFKIHNKWNV